MGGKVKLNFDDIKRKWGEWELEFISIGNFLWIFVVKGVEKWLVVGKGYGKKGLFKGNRNYKIIVCL